MKTGQAIADLKRQLTDKTAEVERLRLDLKRMNAEARMLAADAIYWAREAQRLQRGGKP